MLHGVYLCHLMVFNWVCFAAFFYLFIEHSLLFVAQVLITDVEGPSELNDKEWTVTVTGPFMFTINADASQLPSYVRGGYVRPIKHRPR